MTAVVTGEGVAFDLPRAGIGSRTVATVIDLVLQFLALFGLIAVDSAFAGGDSAGLTAVLIVETLLVLAGYPILCEWLAGGRTLGKQWLGLRVVRDDGGPITFRHALVRGLSSLILEKPGIVVPGIGAAAGMITAATNSRDKRIGDLLAGTYVLNERAGSNRRPMTPVDWPVPWLQPWAATLDLTRLDDRLALTLRQFLSRAGGMTPAARYALGEDLRRAVLAVVTPPPPAWTPTPDLLATVLAERRRRAMPAAGGPARPPAAPAWPASVPVQTPGWPVAPPPGGFPPPPPAAAPPPPAGDHPFAPPR